MAKIQIGVRNAVETDRPFIYRNWIDYGWQHCESAKGKIYGLEHHIYRKMMFKWITLTMERHPPIIAYDTENPKHILGFICGYSTDVAPVVHFLFLKSPLRGKYSIGKTLLKLLGWQPDLPFVVTDSCKWVANRMQKYRILYNPFLRHQELESEIQTAAIQPALPTQGAVLLWDAPDRSKFHTDDRIYREVRRGAKKRNRRRGPVEPGESECGEPQEEVVVLRGCGGE